MPLTLDGESHRLLVMMRFIGKMWEEHGRVRGQPVRISVLLHRVVENSGDDGAVLHVIPSTPVDGDIDYLRQVMRTYTEAGVDLSAGNAVFPRPSPSPGPSSNPPSVAPGDPRGSQPAPATPGGSPQPGASPGGAPPAINDLAAKNAAIDQANAQLGAQRTANAPLDERGVAAFARQWRGPGELSYKDLHHACPALPLIDTQDPAAVSEPPATLKHEDVVAFLSAIGAPNLAAFRWRTILMFTSCVRTLVNFFCPTRNLNRSKPWHQIGPAVANKYTYAVGSVSYVTVSVNQAMAKSSGKHTLERATTLAALYVQSPFWRAACIMFRACNKNVTWGDDPQDAVKRKPRAQSDSSEDSSEGGGKGGVGLDSLLGSDGSSSSDDAGVEPANGRMRKRRKTSDNRGRKKAGLKKLEKNSAAKKSINGKGPKAPAGQQFPLDRAMWTEAPGLDLASRPKTADEMRRSRCTWFWINYAKMGAGALPLSSYQTLGGLYHDRCAKQNFSVQAGTFARLYDVPGDGDCFYHALACGLMDRLAQFPSMPRMPFWTEVGVHPGLLRWAVIAMQRTILENTPTALELLKTWGYLTNLGEPFDHAAVTAQLQDAIGLSEANHLWMGRYNGDYALIANALHIIIKVFRTRGCQSGGSVVPLPYDEDFTIADAEMNVTVDGSGAYVGRVRRGKGTLTFEVSATHVPISFVSQARSASASVPVGEQLSFITQKSLELARVGGCAVMGVVHSGADHFMYPHVYPALFAEFTGASLPAYAL